MRAFWLPDVLREAGLTVVETAGWQTRGYELTAIEGVTCHHTASPPGSTLGTNLHVVTNGNSIAPGPIAQILLWRDGTCHIITSGKANHAGAGGPWGWLPISPPGKLSVANARCLSIEAVNDGVGELWADRMLDAYETAVAAILEHIGQDQSRVFTHHEWAPTRKIDPAGPTGGRIPVINRSQTWSGDAWRARIALRLTHRPDPPPRPPDKPPATPQEDDDMPIAIHVTSEGQPEQLFVIDGSGATMIGLKSPDDRDQLVGAITESKAGGLGTANISADQYMALVQVARTGDN